MRFKRYKYFLDVTAQRLSIMCRLLMENQEQSKALVAEVSAAETSTVYWLKAACSGLYLEKQQQKQRHFRRCCRDGGRRGEGRA